MMGTDFTQTLRLAPAFPIETLHPGGLTLASLKPGPRILPALRAGVL